jgi:iron(III) transport system substrate-binding protein
MNKFAKSLLFVAAGLLLGLVASRMFCGAGCGFMPSAVPPPPAPARELTLYSGRSEDLVQPLLDRFTQDTGIAVKVRYGKTAEMAATILEEGARSPADLYLAQDAGALGALSAAGRLARLPDDLLGRVEARFRSPQGTWVGLSGRARVLVHHPDRAPAESLPADLAGLADPVWKNRIGWSPANGSFQAHVTALRVEKGEAATKAWLEAIKANGARAYANNSSIVLAVAAGEIDVGLVNHYYLHQLRKDRGEDFAARNHSPSGGTLINVAGAGILASSPHREAAERFLRYMLEEPAQRYFAEQTHEYPLSAGVSAVGLPPMPASDDPGLDLDKLEDLAGTLDLLRQVGLL